MSAIVADISALRAKLSNDASGANGGPEDGGIISYDTAATATLVRLLANWEAGYC